MAIDANNIYAKQVQLLVRVLPIVDTEKCFALKGGTAINLFYRPLPRLSVDIDLLYLPMDDRETALKNIREALSRISKKIEQAIPGTKVQDAHEQSDALRLIVSQGEVRIKVELSPVIRGTIFPEVVMEVVEEVENEFGYVEMQVASLPDLYAGKICAALDRQHPRDLFDVKFLLENEGLTDDLRKTFLIFLISHQRPISELLDPNRKDISEIYETEFKEMAEVDVPLNQLEEARENLIHQINSQMTENEKKFLLSFKNKTPDWSLLEMDNIEIVANLPSVKWKMINLEKMPAHKHKEALDKLKQVLKL
ncbi:nucleotidyl transferase AbiEii/AbiGii toxin family protein [Flavobacterium sp. J27]|uniref:nucleotidyl transferase AbiEii/AbiGii toxin family protein n=1 Tax=Flavobacterium sp. J27 TaxID=2060419 RepID=UPI001F0EF12B|nr:nucleotidyl transferase AbiEii/AbiGii toxin family protein [Flavobacterium sp. J27]